MSIKTRKLFLLFLLFPVIGCGNVQGEISYENGEFEYEEELSGNEPELIEPEAYVYVSLTGCIKHPGVYILPKDSRVFEAVNAAGGATEEGDLSAVNLVNIMQDGQQIVIPKIKEESDEYGGYEQTVEDGKVNINTASCADLCTLPGIGESKAKAIISYREKNGKFKKSDEIKQVSGIKDGTFEKIKDSIVAY